MSPTPIATPRVRRRLTRHSDAGTLLETFLVAAVATVLIVRGLLSAAGYPQLGGGGLHVAHLLYGGLLMLVGLLLGFLFLDRRVDYVAAAVSGIGFGLFVDEVGKFVTADNDYFFRPAPALIYVVFVLLFLVLRAVLVGSALTSRESLANVLTLLVDGIDGTIERSTGERIRGLLHGVDAGHPLRAPLEAYVAGLAERPWFLGVVGAAELRAGQLYQRAAANRWFERVLILGMTAYSIASLVSVGLIVVATGGVGRGGVPELVETGSTVAGALLVLRGVVELTVSHARAYRWFIRGVLVWTLVTQVFVFYSSQFAGLGGLAANLVAYGVLRFMLHRELSTGRIAS